MMMNTFPFPLACISDMTNMKIKLLLVQLATKITTQNNVFWEIFQNSLHGNTYSLVNDMFQTDHSSRGRLLECQHSAACT